MLGKRTINDDDDDDDDDDDLVSIRFSSVGHWFPKAIDLLSIEQFLDHHENHLFACSIVDTVAFMLRN